MQNPVLTRLGGTNQQYDEFCLANFYFKTMKQIKLRDLYQECTRLMKKGYGEKSLILSNDNEGNGYHGMFYTLTVITPENKDGFIGLIDDNTEANLMNLIVVG